MKQICLCIVILVASCGLSARQNELVGQVKKVIDHTPLICGDYTTADISLGLIRNGTGSMSKEDVIVVLQTKSDIATAKRAAQTGEIVSVTYDIERLAICTEDHVATQVVIANNYSGSASGSAN